MINALYYSDIRGMKMQSQAWCRAMMISLVLSEH